MPVPMEELSEFVCELIDADLARADQADQALFAMAEGKAEYSYGNFDGLVSLSLLCRITASHACIIASGLPLDEERYREWRGLPGLVRS